MTVFERYPPNGTACYIFIFFERRLDMTILGPERRHINDGDKWVNSEDLSRTVKGMLEDLHLRGI